MTTMKTMLLVSCVVGMASSSAIPMWEYLSKDEKMAYLYNMFANQVEKVCEKGPNFERCTQDLLKYGLRNLHGMPEDHLDAMDPYQRGANNLIWKSMMDGHEMMHKAQKSSSTPTPQTDDTYESNYLGSASNQQTTSIRAHYGPMEVRVHPDGRPVASAAPLPLDDDLHHHHIVRVRVPPPST